MPTNQPINLLKLEKIIQITITITILVNSNYNLLYWTFNTWLGSYGGGWEEKKYDSNRALNALDTTTGSDEAAVEAAAASDETDVEAAANGDDEAPGCLPKILSIFKKYFLAAKMSILGQSYPILTTVYPFL